MIDTRKLNGQKGAYLQPLKYGENESGPYSLLRWEGTYNEVRANIPWVQQMGGVWEFSESFTGGKCVLEARIPRNFYLGEQPVNTWEFFSQMAEKDILGSDNQTVVDIGPFNCDIIRHFIQNPPVLGDPVNFEDFIDEGPGTRDQCAALYQLVSTGFSAIRVNAPVLRNTTTVSNVYALQVSLSNIGKIISTASLNNLEGVPADTVSLLPNDTSNKTGFGYGWYKKHPTIRRAARQKTQVEREWEYGLWPTLIYGAAL